MVHRYVPLSKSVEKFTPEKDNTVGPPAPIKWEKCFKIKPLL